MHLLNTVTAAQTLPYIGAAAGVRPTLVLEMCIEFGYNSLCSLGGSVYQRLVVLAMAVCVFAFACGEIDPSKPQTFDAGQPDGGTTSNNQTTPTNIVTAPKIRVATLNTRRFFDTSCDSGRCETGDFEDVFSEAELDFKAEQVAAGIREMNADAVMLQEIESEEALVALYEKVSDIYSIAILGEIGGSASLDTAILARGEYLGTISHISTQLTRPDGSTTGFARDFLEVRVRFNGVQVHLFSAHFKAKRNDDPGRRFAEAEGARDIAYTTAQDNPGSLVIIGGDLNDTPDSDPIQAMVAGGFLDLVDGPTEDWWTYGFGDSREALDHILIVSDDRFSPVEPIEIFRDSGGGFASSDHSAVAADIILPAN